jgi:signal peptidase I
MTSAEPELIQSGSAPAAPRGAGFLAIAAAITLPGLGHAVSGHGVRGMKWFAVYVFVAIAGIASLLIPPMVPLLIVLLPLSLLIQVANWIDAYRMSKRGGNQLFKHAALRYLVGTILLCVTFGGWPAMAAAVILRNRYVEAFKIPPPPPELEWLPPAVERPGGSMAPTMVHADRFVVHKKLGLQRWSVVAFYPPGIPGARFVMRIAGLPGESVRVTEKGLFINDKRIEPPLGVGPYHDFGGATPSNSSKPYTDSITLGTDEYFLLGDNAETALDSRFWRDAYPGRRLGAVPAAQIIGPATYVYWPPQHWRRLY